MMLVGKFLRETPVSRRISMPPFARNAELQADMAHSADYWLFFGENKVTPA